MTQTKSKDDNYIEIPRMNMKSSIFAELINRIKELEVENKQLKELLKELRISVMFDKDLVEKIDEVLKEC